jgi:hypothetical protein
MLTNTGIGIKIMNDKRYSIEWCGIITRDIGWDEVVADSPDEARERYLNEHGNFRKIRSVIEITAGPYDNEIDSR